ncbi:M20/M25/M40 family metallo-hydrolase [Elizabethkingia meningoseptica]|nr:M28 family peptidase [Elizabethkingia meningoseptica]MDX8575997.1 M20/M25/M40 family metallo-hydrolase [Elizabethkingia sp. HX WYD]EJK5329363.1 M20/M25/M40 family metallo-hydrolase [Elizabethkingia meningoseptica]MBG0514195.1 M20/M25/M40 family metallo-hydrolase [Elizabethkingia meningoseptica]MCL1675523.1 M20/M25/M40 family metallo-hydrolase [Elizabethkingia meningoseptica]MDE5430684.1 M20/M25/M40 family metallo-hydrolase [Elizabethkingia meningoseptica]
MSMYKKITLSALVISAQFWSAQQTTQEKLDPTVQNIVNEATKNSQLENLAFELLDVIGPRLVGSPAMKQANDWAVEKYKGWGIDAKNQQYGEWASWQRGITQVEMTSPRIKSLESMQLAWSPATKKPIDAEVVILPKVNNPSEFTEWLKSAKGKFVLMAQYQRSGRPDYQIKEFATPELYNQFKAQRDQDAEDFRNLIKNTGYDNNTLPEALEKAGVAGIAISNWTGIMGANRIFGAKTKNIPMIDIAVEDYGMLYRLALNGKKPTIKVNTQSKNLGTAKSFNTIARIEGKEKPNEYVILSAHLDSWDGAQGATDNGTGTITMMEAARILKKFYPNNKRTIIIGHWGSEEQGLNGSRAFVVDNPEIIKNTQVAFNQDNGTGRVVNIQGQGFVDSYDYLTRWMSALPKSVSKHIETSFPGMPGGGGSDHASFVAAGVPGISLSSLNWGYFGYTWHTNRDTYDKIMFDEVKNNVIAAAVMAYMASEDPEFVSRQKRVLPAGQKWPEVKEPKRKGTN